MYKNLPENIFLPELEREILEFWQKDNTFAKSISSKDGKKTFTFYEGPPSANGNPGIHHVISRTIKDLICRYKSMQGYMVYRKAGWDTQGLPIEVEVEKSLGLKSKEDIEKFGSIAFNKACKDSIFKYLKEWEDLTRRMGYWINLNDAYVTFHNQYIESAWWAIKKYFDADLIYKGFKILPFCPTCESPLSFHEVAQGYEDLKDPSVYLKFKITSGENTGSDFLVWTTTPWTLLSNAALAVNPEAIYVKIKTSKGDNLILAKARLEIINEEYTIEKELTGKELELTQYERLFDFLKDDKNAFYVTPGDFVTMEDGSGIVHIAPAFGEDDYQIGLKYDLPLFIAVGKNGLFIDDIIPYKGKNFKEADADIIKDLKNKGRLYRKEMFVHSYPHCWRHRVPLMYYATDSWFIRTTQYKQKMVEMNKEIHWHPDSYGTGRFGKWLNENRDWALSRNRFWGTPLPIWQYTDDSGEEHFECIGSINELKEKSINFDKIYPDEQSLDLHKPYIDDIIVMSKDGKQMRRVNELADVWFDSGCVPFAQHHYPFVNKELFEKNYPADFVAEGIDQTRGWFYTMHAIGTFLFNKPAYRNVIVNGLILDKNGKKMSKSLGNIVNPFDMMERYGADVLRWYMIYSSPIGNSKMFNEDELIEVQNKFFDTLINVVRFFIIYSNISKFSYDADKKVSSENRPMIDRWILSKFDSTRKKYFELMDNYDITKATRILFDFTIDELSNWHVRRNRKRLRNFANDTDGLSGYQTLHEVITELLKLIAPVSPFLTDKLYMTLSDAGSSIHLAEFSAVDESLINSSLEEEMKLAQNIVSLVRSIRVKNNLRVRQPLRQILIPVLNDKDKKRIQNVKDIILEEVNVRELKLIEGDSDIIVKKSKPNFKSIGPKFGKDVKTVQNILCGLTPSQISDIEKTGKLELEDFNFTNEDVEIYTDTIEGWIVDTNGDLTIALDTKLDDTLIEEGIVREFVNRIQNFRRTNDFDVNDKVRIYFKTSENISLVIYKYLEYIKSETFSENIDGANGFDFDFTKSDINGEPIELYLKKIN